MYLEELYKTRKQDDRRGYIYDTQDYMAEIPEMLARLCDEMRQIRIILQERSDIHEND